MYKIAILGSENSHARAFSQIMNTGHPLLGGAPCADFQVIGVCGDNPEENKYLCETYNIPETSDDGDFWLGRVDAVMVTARSGAKHLSYAKKYIESGVPAFIDKPITIDEDEALELARLAKSKNVPLCGGSCCGLVTDTVALRELMKSGNLGYIFGGAVTAPVSMKNDWGDFFFYSQHLVQMMMEVFGSDIESVLALGRDDAATFIARYANYDVTGHYGPGCYSVNIHAGDRVVHKDIDIVTDGYVREFERFANMVRTGKMPTSYEELIAPVFVLNAIDKSLKTGELTPVRKFAL